MTKPASDQKFAFSIVTAYNWGNFQLGSAGFGATRSFEPAGAVSLGFRFEFIPPFHGYKWSIILEPTFQGNKSTYKSSGKVDYHTLEIPFGVKYSFYLSDRTALYLNGFLITDLPTNASATLGTETYHCTSPSISFAAGAGFVVGRFSIGARKYFERSALATTHKYFFVYDKVMLLVGFRVTTAAGKK